MSTPEFPYDERATELPKEVWAASISNKLISDLRIARLSLKSKIVTVDSCLFQSFAVKALSGQDGSYLQFINCTFAGDVSILRARKLSGIMFVNCRVEGDLVLHDLDAVNHDTVITIKNTTVLGTTKLVSSVCKDFIIENAELHSLLMDQSEAWSELRIESGTVISGRTNLSTAADGKVTIKNSSFNNLFSIYVGNEGGVLISDVSCETLSLKPRSETSSNAKIEVSRSRCQNLYVENMPALDSLKISQSSIDNILKISCNLWSQDSTLAVHDVQDCSQFVLNSQTIIERSGETKLSSKDSNETPTNGYFKLFLPTTVRLDQVFLEYFEKRNKNGYEPSLGKALERYYLSHNEAVKADRALYRRRLQHDKKRIKSGKYSALFSLFVFGYTYGYGVRLTNQLMFILALSILLALLVKVGSLTWFAWFFEEPASPSLLQMTNIIVETYLGIETEFGQPIGISKNGMLSIALFRALAFLSLSGTIIRKIGRH